MSIILDASRPRRKLWLTKEDIAGDGAGLPPIEPPDDGDGGDWDEERFRKYVISNLREMPDDLCRRLPPDFPPESAMIFREIIEKQVRDALRKLGEEF